MLILVKELQKAQDLEAPGAQKATEKEEAELKMRIECMKA